MGSQLGEQAAQPGAAGQRGFQAGWALALQVVCQGVEEGSERFLAAAPVAAALQHGPAAPDGVLVRIEAGMVLSYMGRVLSGAAPYSLPPMPFVPGTNAIGRVVATGENVSHVRSGDRVFIYHSGGVSAVAHSSSRRSRGRGGDARAPTPPAFARFV